MLKSLKAYETINLKLLPMAVTLVLVFSLGCSKKKTEEATLPTGDGSMDSNISGQEMKFDAQGSDSGSISGLRTVFFPYDSSTLTSEARRDLQGNADWLKSNSAYKMQIEGHCDSRGSIEYNLALGEKRARSVRSYLINLGVSGERLSIISYGEEKPLAQGDGEDSMSRNRRANFLPLSL